MTVEIEPVTISDVPDIVALHVQTFGPERHLGVLFGQDYLHRMYAAAVFDPRFVVVKACSDGKMIGFSSARLEGYHAMGVAAIDWKAATTFALNVRRILRPSVLRRLIGRQWSERRLCRLRRKPYAQAYITCVAQEHRGSGVGSLLRRKMYEECRRQKADYIYTGILMDNGPMLAISRRDGFREIVRDRIGLVVYLEKFLGEQSGPHNAEA